MKEINIDPITRLEGHGSVSIFLNDDGEVENAYLKVPELRGFEAFCVGRPAELMPIITTRICGVCPVAHHLASVKTLDAAFHVDPPAAAKKLRELQFMGSFIGDHTLHFYYLGGPDFIVGPDAPPDKRNILGVIEKAGLDVAKEVIKHRAYGQKITEIIGGRATHPVSGLPGGMSKALSEESRLSILEMARSSVTFAQFTLQLFHDLVLDDPKYMEMFRNDACTMRTYYMGTVDARDRVNFYDGELRVVDPAGREFSRFRSADYAEHITERVEEWTFSKFPYLKQVGWNGSTPALATAYSGSVRWVGSTPRKGWPLLWPRRSTSGCSRRSGSRPMAPWCSIGRAWSNCCTPPSGRWNWPATRRSPARTYATSRANRARAWASSRRPGARSYTTTAWTGTPLSRTST